MWDVGVTSAMRFPSTQITYLVKASFSERIKHIAGGGLSVELDLIQYGNLSDLRTLCINAAAMQSLFPKCFSVLISEPNLPSTKHYVQIRVPRKHTEGTDIPTACRHVSIILDTGWLQKRMQKHRASRACDTCKRRKIRCTGKVIMSLPFISPLSFRFSLVV